MYDLYYSSDLRGPDRSRAMGHADKQRETLDHPLHALCTRHHHDPRKCPLRCRVVSSHVTQSRSRVSCISQRVVRPNATQYQ